MLRDMGGKLGERKKGDEVWELEERNTERLSGEKMRSSLWERWASGAAELVGGSEVHTSLFKATGTAAG